MTDNIEELLADIESEQVVPWIEEQLQNVDLKDKRLNLRIIDTATRLAAQPTAPINQACDDWAATKGSYRLFANDKVTAERVLAPSQERTVERMKNHPLVLSVQDTSVLNYTRHPKTKDLGPIGTSQQTLRGLLMHTTLVYTPEGLPVGLLTQEIWTRSDEDPKLTAAERQKRPIEEKESYKWLKALRETVSLAPNGCQVVTVCDREADIYELFVEAHQLNTGLLIRATQNRMLMDAEEKHLWASVEAEPAVAQLQVDVPAKKKEPARQATVSVRFRSVTLRPPSRPKVPGQEPLPAIVLDAVLVQEVDPPAGMTRLEWMLLTNVAVQTKEDAIERVAWYRQRWPIEIFHRILKSGCRVEDCRLQTKDRLVPYLALSSIISWRLYWLTHISRHKPNAPCLTVLAEHEWRALYAKIHRTATPPEKMPTVYEAMRWIARLGGFLGRKGDGEPGPTVMWRGWQRLTDIADTWLILHPTSHPSGCG